MKIATFGVPPVPVVPIYFLAQELPYVCVNANNVRLAEYKPVFLLWCQFNFGGYSGILVLTLRYMQRIGSRH